MRLTARHRPKLKVRHPCPSRRFAVIAGEAAASDRQGMLGASSWRKPPGDVMPAAASGLHAGNHVRKLGSTAKSDAAQDVWRRRRPSVERRNPALGHHGCEVQPRWTQGSRTNPSSSLLRGGWSGITWIDDRYKIPYPSSTTGLRSRTCDARRTCALRRFGGGHARNGPPVTSDSEGDANACDDGARPRASAQPVARTR